MRYVYVWVRINNLVLLYARTSTAVLVLVRVSSLGFRDLELRLRILHAYTMTAATWFRNAEAGTRGSQGYAPAPTVLARRAGVRSSSKPAIQAAV